LYSPSFHPLKEDHQAPKVIPDIGFSFQMPGQKVFDGVLSKELAVFRDSFPQGIDEHRTQRAAEPFMRGNIKTRFLAFLDGGWELVFAHFTQNEFLLRSANLQVRRQLSGKLHDAMIEEWWPHFDGMSHAHAVAFHQNVVCKLMFLI